MWTKPGPPVIPGPVLRACLAREWGLPGAAVAVHDGGMNSATWLVRHGTRRWVAKAVVPAAGRAFAAGLAVAAALERAGVPAGAPVPGATGTTVVRAGGYPLALLTWVPGAPLGTGAAAQRLIGATLARVHRALAGVRVAGTERFHWVDRAAGHLAVRPWVRPAVTAAVRALAGLDPDRLTWGLLHTDPAPEAFRYDPATGTCGVIDWSTALAGPLLYDLASAVMYAGGPAAGTELVAAYLDGGPLTRTEVDRGLATMLRFRWAVQADYFARRLVDGDLTGIAGTEGNEQGLAHARALLAPDHPAGPAGPGG